MPVRHIGQYRHTLSTLAGVCFPCRSFTDNAPGSSALHCHSSQLTPKLLYVSDRVLQLLLILFLLNHLTVANVHFTLVFSILYM